MEDTRFGIFDKTGTTKLTYSQERCCSYYQKARHIQYDNSNMAFNAVPHIPIQQETDLPSFSNQMVYFTVTGRPLPMPRPRFRLLRNTGRVLRPYIPFRTNNASTTSVRNVVTHMIPTGVNAPVFEKGYKVAVFVTFRVRRPNAHFVGSDRTSGAL